MADDKRDEHAGFSVLPPRNKRIRDAILFNFYGMKLDMDGKN